MVRRQVPVLRTGNFDISSAAIQAGPPWAIQQAAATLAKVWWMTRSRSLKVPRAAFAQIKTPR